MFKLIINILAAGRQPAMVIRLKALGQLVSKWHARSKSPYAAEAVDNLHHRSSVISHATLLPTSWLVALAATLTI